jgi:hypothetical protein
VDGLRRCDTKRHDNTLRAASLSFNVRRNRFKPWLTSWLADRQCTGGPHGTPIAAHGVERQEREEHSFGELGDEGNSFE